MTKPPDLAPCPDKPNCVSSLEQPGKHYIEPISFTDTADAAMNRLQMVISTSAGATIKTTKAGYIRVEYRSPVFGFIDDLELILDRDKGHFDVRSASRKGYYDFNANAKRVEALREAFNKAGNTTG